MATRHANQKYERISVEAYDELGRQFQELREQHEADTATIARLTTRDSAYTAVVEAARQVREQFYRHTCELHAPMICDKCEALDALDAALKLAAESTEVEQ